MQPSQSTWRPGVWFAGVVSEGKAVLFQEADTHWAGCTAIATLFS